MRRWLRQPIARAPESPSCLARRTSYSARSLIRFGYTENVAWEQRTRRPPAVEIRETYTALRTASGMSLRTAGPRSPSSRVGQPHPDPELQYEAVIAPSARSLALVTRRGTASAPTGPWAISSCHTCRRTQRRCVPAGANHHRGAAASVLQRVHPIQHGCRSFPRRSHGASHQRANGRRNERAFDSHR